MYNIQTLNNISAVGLGRLPTDSYVISDDSAEPDAILLRSFKMHDMEIPSSLQAVGRAGSGVNNIPVDKLTKLGIPVFNAPGANANAVKELVIAAMLLASRNICPAWQYSCQLEGSDAEIAKAVEAGKKKFVGTELPGKTLGVVGLGAIGVKIANAARDLGMRVIGFDPQMTVQSAWQLESTVESYDNIDTLLKEVDFVTFHVPLIDVTKNLINTKRLKTMRDGVTILNFARDGIVDDSAVLEALDSGKVRSYVCDFPSNENKNHPKVVVLPHLGASTAEAEDNCAIMVAEQVKDYLENGNIKNAVNFPNVSMPRSGQTRLSVVNENVPNMVGQISSILAEAHLNIVDLLNKSKGDVAYNLVDIEGDLPDEVIDKIQAIDGVLVTRKLS